jgi:hypothetical protein
VEPPIRPDVLSWMKSLAFEAVYLTDPISGRLSLTVPVRFEVLSETKSLAEPARSLALSLILSVEIF